MKSVYQFTVLAMCLALGAHAAPRVAPQALGEEKNIFTKRDVIGCFPYYCKDGVPCCHGTCDAVTKKCPPPPNPPQM
ncbi:unnamed protein product [Zymoseptoria tritici ST99CH_1A5]|uniref:Granulins domain-containing protein n=1 Tax=Zymoseptoria tritici ST99CH_1A5 TaxID=1276529 RepID=A0A1Y6LHB0_ZYMTR|nr:unnamed protein product [Zymoseptoria tritici ST99CH_1A5]